jgi:hypothetical protein
MFRNYALNKMKKCCTIEDYAMIRNLLDEYGIEKFRFEMEEKGIFIGNTINTKNNAFAEMVLGKKSHQWEEIDEDFILIDSNENITHKFIVPKMSEWDSFNVLTLSKKHVELLKRMRNIAFLYAFEYRIRKFGLYFHCYPFNSVHTLHLHIVDLNTEPEFLNKTNNLKLDDIISYLEQMKE